MKKFTFKTEQPTGRYRSFDKPTYHIKYDKKEVGYIKLEKPHKIHLQVLKTEEDLKKSENNINCEWRWLRIKYEFESVDAAKLWLNENIEKILNAFSLYIEKD